MNLRFVVALLAVVFFSANADARSPARKSCTLSKKDQARALTKVQERFPQIKRLAKERSCYCNFATEDCSLVDLEFETVEIAAPESKIRFQLRVKDSFWLKKPRDVAMFEDDVEKFDFEKAAKSIRKFAATIALFGDTPLLCDAKGREQSVSVACAETTPRAQLGGGRPKAGAKVISIPFNHNKKPEVWLLAAPLETVSKMDDWRWRVASRRPKVEAFLEKNPNPTIVIRKREVEVLGEGYKRVSVRFDKSPF